MGWRPSEGLKAFMNTRRKMRQFYCRKTVWLDGGKIKAVCAEEYTALPCIRSFEHPAAFTPKWHKFFIRER